MLRNVAVVVMHDFHPFEFGVICEVFGIDRREDGLPSYDFAVVGAEPGPIRSSSGFDLVPGYGLDRLAEADLIALPAVSDSRLHGYPAALRAELRSAVSRGVRVLSVCSGAFILGEAGLLDGRRCTTHWRYADLLATRFPHAKVDPDVLYVDDDPVISSAGTAAGIDACLYLVRKELGSRVANGIARRMVVPPHRDGGQAQYIDRPVATRPDGARGELTVLLDWLGANLAEPLSVRQLAARANMSERTLGRRFVHETGTTPQRWLTGQRILLAQQLLEDTGETVDRIAELAGFGNATAMRHHFRVWRGTTPNAYRRMFRGTSLPPGPTGPVCSGPYRKTVR